MGPSERLNWNVEVPSSVGGPKGKNRWTTRTPVGWKPGHYLHTNKHTIGKKDNFKPSNLIPFGGPKGSRIPWLSSSRRSPSRKIRERFTLIRRKCKERLFRKREIKIGIKTPSMWETIPLTLPSRTIYLLVVLIFTIHHWISTKKRKERSLSSDVVEIFIELFRTSLCLLGLGCNLDHVRLLFGPDCYEFISRINNGEQK